MSVYSNPVGPVEAGTGVAAGLAWTVQPSATAVGAIVTPAPTVQVVDASGKPVGDVVEVTVALSPGSFASGSATVGETDSTGVCPFGILKAPSAGTYTVTATAKNLTSAVSGPFTVGAPPLTSVGLVRTVKAGKVTYVLSGKPALSGTYTDRAAALAQLAKEADRLP